MAKDDIVLKVKNHVRVLLSPFRRSKAVTTTANFNSKKNNNEPSEGGGLTPKLENKK